MPMYETLCSPTSWYIYHCDDLYMYWAWHLTRIKDIGQPKQQFYDKLQHARCWRHKLKVRFKDVLKSNPKMLSINIRDLEQIMVNQSTWKKIWEINWFPNKKVLIFVQRICLKSCNLYICKFAFYNQIAYTCYFLNIFENFADENIWLAAKIRIKTQYKEIFSLLEC